MVLKPDPFRSPPPADSDGQIADAAGVDLDLYQTYREYVRHEDNLINFRLNWNFTIQGFLFTSYTFALNKLSDIRLDLAKGLIQQPGPAQAAVHELRTLLVVMAGVGFFVSVFVYLGAIGARIAIFSLWRAWRNIGVKQRAVSSARIYTKLPDLVGGGGDTAHTFGFHAPNFLPLIFAVAWAILEIYALG